MTHCSLEEKLQAAGSAVKMVRNAPIGPFHIPCIPAECSNWRDEQRAWRESVALLDLTHHMTDLTIRGPDTIHLLSDLGVNSFKEFAPGKAKQFICCNQDGYMIGDGILFFIEENHIKLLGLPMAHNWVNYHAESGRYRVSVERDDATAPNSDRERKLYRFQIQGPHALKVLEQASGEAPPEIKFFNIGTLNVAGHTVRALRHGMSSAPGLELFGPHAEGDDVRAALVRAGAQFGLREVGYLAYPTTTLESGWIPGPVPAIYTGEDLKLYREWLPPNGYEGGGSLGGSFDSQDITDYYVTPYELGYGPFIKFDHDFIGRAALEAMGDQPKRRKVTLAWDADDVTAAMHTLFQKGDPARFFNLPWSNYAHWTRDKVLQGERLVGVSNVCGYSANERAMLSLALVDASVPIGAEVTVIWGEAQPRASGPSAVERHRQTKIRAIVSPCPYSEVARTTYAEGWRSK